jgi:hypothetical protein
MLGRPAVRFHRIGGRCGIPAHDSFEPDVEEQPFQGRV